MTDDELPPLFGLSRERWKELEKSPKRTKKELLAAIEAERATARAAEEKLWEEKPYLRPKHERTTSSASEQPPRSVYFTSMKDVSMRAIDWLWVGWIPRGYITIWAGESGAGKSTVLADVAARITTGRAWPGEPESLTRAPAGVFWLSSEDGAAELTKPRLVACGANVELVWEISSVTSADGPETFSMQDDIKEVRHALHIAREQGTQIGMLVIDPVTSYLSGRKNKRVDMNDAGQLRAILEPWLPLAQEYNLAIVCVTHFTKDSSRSMLNRVLGSGAFAQTCRSLCAIVARPAEGPYAKVLVQVKVNLPDHPGGAFRFTTVRVHVGDDEATGRAISATRPDWGDLDPTLTPESLSTLLPSSAPTGGLGGVMHPKFENWLSEYFTNSATVDGWLPVTTVKLAALESGNASEKSWSTYSGRYLEKKNTNGPWLCRMKQKG